MRSQYRKHERSHIDRGCVAHQQQGEVWVRAGARYLGEVSLCAVDAVDTVRHDDDGLKLSAVTSGGAAPLQWRTSAAEMWPQASRLVHVKIATMLSALSSSIRPKRMMVSMQWLRT